jgi:hypothetical protein
MFHRLERTPAVRSTKEGTFMNRRVIDYLVSSAGLIVAIVLLAVGGLMVWGQVFINHQVHDQLASQKIFFPPKGSPATAGPQFAAMRQYAGQQLTTGAQAETYANHFIAVHLSEVAGGKTYAQVSAAALANPTNTTLKTQEQTLFQGTTLRGLLLNAYAFGTVARIAGIAAIVSFVGGGILLVLSILGFVHGRRASSATAAATATQQATETRAA